MSAKFDSVAAFQKHGYTFAGFFDAVKTGFVSAYEERKAEGFNPDGPMSEESKDRVLKVFEVLEAQYGNVDLKALGPIAVISAMGLFQQLNEVIQGLESFSNAKPEDFDKVREAIKAKRDASNAPTLANIGQYAGGAAN